MNERLLNEEIKPGPDTAPETTSFGEVQMVREVWPIPGGRVAALDADEVHAYSFRQDGE